MRYLSLFILLSILFSCSNVRMVKRHSPHPKYIKQINHLGQRNIATIALINSSEFDAENIIIHGDTLQFTSEINNKINILVLDEVNSIEFKDRLLGFIQGLGLGTLIGVGVGAVTIIGETDPMAGLAIIAGGIAGAASGLVFGIILGSTHKYEFRDSIPEQEKGN